MIDIFKAASFICKEYAKVFKKPITELKLHKLLYFLQRESLVRNGKPLFDEPFVAGEYGPVALMIRDAYKENKLNIPLDLCERLKYNNLIKSVVKLYGKRTDGILIVLSRGEYCWRHAYQKDGANAENLISIEDIKIDAENVKQRRFLFRKKQNR